MQSGRGLSDPKWQLPGWRIEQKYATGVLIGNWSEDRLGKVHEHDEYWFGSQTCPGGGWGEFPLVSSVFKVIVPQRTRTQFHRGSDFGNSTHRTDFRFYSPTDYQPDVSTRRRGMLMNDVGMKLYL